ncbi:response regulator, partial [Thermodesulfobacteriota bacterium]
MAKLLVIDDNNDNLATAQALLTSLIPGCSVSTASSGSEGIRRAGQESPDCILLDINMPGLDGYEACRRLKASAATGHIPIMLLTAVRTDSADRVKGLDSGADAFLSKPIDGPELVAQVKVLLRIKQAEDALRSERFLLSHAIRQTSETVIIMNAEGAVEYVNPAVEKLTGYGPDEAIGKNPFGSDRGIYDPSHYREIWDSINAGRECTYRMQHRKKDGDTVELETTFSPVRDDAGAIVNFVSIGRDVTHEAMLEKELRQAQKMEAIGTLAGGIAHDFNNILAAAMGYTEMAIDKAADTTRAAGYMRHVLQAVRRARDLVFQILSFSRQTEQKIRPVKVGPIIKETVKFLRASLPSTIEISEHIQTGEDIVLADPTQIHQVLMNLCTNAKHAMQERGGVLEVRLDAVTLDADGTAVRPGLGPGRYLQLIVSDTGCGMEASVQERIFEPFYTTKAQGEGTGLGLSVVHGIVASFGASIRVDSTPGKGTEFQVYLPLHEVEAEEEESEPGPVPGGSERVLLVDDEEVIVDMVRGMLERLGYSVTSTTSSPDALERFSEAPDSFDLVLSDQTMPG